MNRETEGPWAAEWGVVASDKGPLTAFSTQDIDLIREALWLCVNESIREEEASRLLKRLDALG